MTTVLENEEEEELELFDSSSPSWTMITVGTITLAVVRPGGGPALLVSVSVTKASMTPLNRPWTCSTTRESSSNFGFVLASSESSNTFSLLLSSWTAISPTATFSWLLRPALISGARIPSTILR